MNQSMGDSVMVNRSSQPPPQTIQPSRQGAGPTGVTPQSVHRSQQQRPASAVTCNRCREPLSDTIFVCACDCVFCEECTYQHFHTSSNCPACQRVLSENDFMELAVADPSSTTAAPTTKESSFQRLFTKKLAGNANIPFVDVCGAVLQQHDDSRASFKFLLKQLLMENSKLQRVFESLKQQSTTLKQESMTLKKESTILKQEYATLKQESMTLKEENTTLNQEYATLKQESMTLKQENTTLKQAAQAQKMRYETLLETTQQQLSAANKKLQEKDHQIQQFQKLRQVRSSSSATNTPHASPGKGLRCVSTTSCGGPFSSVVPRPRVTEQPPHPRQQPVLDPDCRSTGDISDSERSRALVQECVAAPPLPPPASEPAAGQTADSETLPSPSFQAPRKKRKKRKTMEQGPPPPR